MARASCDATFRSPATRGSKKAIARASCDAAFRPPAWPRARQQKARSPNYVRPFSESMYFTAMEWICTKCVMRSSAGKVADEKFRGEESCHEGLWISTLLRFAAARGGGGAREPASMVCAAVDITTATCSLLCLLAAFCLLLTTATDVMNNKR